MACDCDGPIVFGGIAATALVVVLFCVVMYCVDPESRHDVGWGHVVCVETTDIPSKEGTPQKKSTHCVTGKELAQWAQERGR